ncbi:MAG TPA: TetR/AcrR family transcriptional regulator [Thermoleophilaceae bacterium]
MSSSTEDTRAAKAARGTRSGAKPARGGASAKAPPAGGDKRGGSAPPRRRLSAEQRRAAILDAALEVFAKHGYHAASIDDIAGVATVSKALIYEHFPSKRHLHAALLERHVGELFGLLVESAATSEPGEVRLRAGVDAFLAFVETRPDAFRMLFRDAVEPEVAEVLRTLGQQAARQVAELIATEPRERRADDEEEDEAIEMLGALLTGAVQSLALWWDEHPKVPRERLVERTMEFAWLGFERLRAGERLKETAA